MDDEGRGAPPWARPGPYVITVTWGALPYRVEVVPAPRWDARLGRPWRGGEHCRVVFLQAPGEVPPEEIRDTRIAVLVPAGPTGALREPSPAYTLSTSLPK